MKIKTLILTFESDYKMKGYPEILRGYFGRRFEKYVLMHHHTDVNKYLYLYPLVQYKMLNSKSAVVGIDIGAELLREIYKKVDVIDVKGNKYEIFEKTIELSNMNFGSNATQIPYSFLTPWLALNEKNYEKYQKFGTWAERKKLLESILVGNIISMSKSLGYTVPEPIKANIIKIKEVKTKLKGVPMLGFLGTFSINFEIPDYWGIGKSVSRGFGTVMKIKSEQ